ncbi:LacI family transcriptional regulator [Streptomyces pathocidini]|uniref:LacI family transcriptional regulator n=1 Tax=Streptomyces pathocidini TaxID=1650571 RepID=A0ABW7UUP9_9ACTN|nr:LacI family transcriptional regulator [Streptomyces pathocidini]
MNSAQAFGAVQPFFSKSRASYQMPWTLAVPVVVVERRHQPAADVPSLDYVITDHEHGATQAVRHLARLGHRRIALVARPTPTSV